MTTWWTENFGKCALRRKKYQSFFTNGQIVRFSDCLLQSLGSYLLWRMFHTLWCARMQTSAIKAIHGLHVAHPILLLPPALCHHGGGSSLPRNWSATMKHQCTIRTVLAEISGTVGGHSVVKLWQLVLCILIDTKPYPKNSIYPFLKPLQGQWVHHLPGEPVRTVHYSFWEETLPNTKAALRKPSRVNRTQWKVGEEKASPTIAAFRADLGSSHKLVWSFHLVSLSFSVHLLRNDEP